MKLVFVTPRPWPLKGGVESHVHNLAEAIGDSQKASVTVLSQYIASDETNVKRFKSDKYSHDFFKIPGPSYYAFSLKIIRHAIRLVNSGSILHLQAAHKPLSMLILLFLNKRQKNNVFFTMHYHGEGHSKIASLAHIFYRPILSLSLKHIRKVIAVSEPEQRMIREHFPHLEDRVVVIPNGVGEVKEVKNGNEVTIISRLEKYKNIDKAINNIPEGITLNIVGTGSYEKELKHLAASKTNILFHGHLSEEAYEEIWSKTGLLVSLSDKEAYGMVIAESIARGVPVIASNIPAHKFVYELSKKSPLFNFEIENLKTQISSLINDKSDKIGYNFFTWKDAAKMTIESYEEAYGAKNIR
jgi:glycosyltransferase involved in cell wall biosynthesis